MSSSKPATREANRRRNSMQTYTKALVQDSTDATEVSHFMAKFKKSSAKYETEFQTELGKYPNTLAKHYKNLVPSQVSHRTFVQRYYFRCCDEERILNELEASNATSSSGDSSGGHHHQQQHDKSNDRNVMHHQRFQSNDKIMQLPKRNVVPRGESLLNFNSKDEKKGVQRCGSDRLSSRPSSGNHKSKKPTRSASSDDPEAAAAAAAKFGDNFGPGRPTSSNVTTMPPSALKKPSSALRSKRAISDQTITNGTASGPNVGNVYPQRGSTGALVRFRGVPEAEPARRAAWESEESHIKKMHTNSTVAPPTPFQRQESLVGSDSLQSTISSALRSRGLSSNIGDENDSTDSPDSPPSLASIRQHKQKQIKSVLKQAVDPTKPPAEPSRPGWHVRERPTRPTTGIPVIPKRHTSADHSGHSQRSTHSIPTLSLSAHSRGSSRASFGSESLIESDTEHTEYDNEDDESATIPSVDLSRENSGASIEDTMRMWGAAMRSKKDGGGSQAAGTTITKPNSSSQMQKSGQRALVDDEVQVAAKTIPSPVPFQGKGSDTRKRPSSSSIDSFDSIEERSDESGNDEDRIGAGQQTFSHNTPAAWREAFSKKKGSQRRLSYSETDEETDASNSGPADAWKAALKPSKKAAIEHEGYHKQGNDAPWRSTKLRPTSAPTSSVPLGASHESVADDDDSANPTRIKSTASMGSAESGDDMDGSQDSRKHSAPSLDAYFNRKSNETADSSGAGSGGSVSERRKMWSSQSDGVHQANKEKPTIIVPLKDKVKKYGTPSMYPKRNSSNDSLLSSETNASAGSIAMNIHYQLAVKSVAQVGIWRSEPETYTTSLDIGDMTMEDSRAYRELVGRYDPSRKEDDIQIALAKYPDSVGVQYKNLVPDQVSRDDFWLRYFFRCDEKRVLRALRRKEAAGPRPPDVVELGGERVGGDSLRFQQSKHKTEIKPNRAFPTQRSDGTDDLDLSIHTTESMASVKDRLKSYEARVSNSTDDSSSASGAFSSPRASQRGSWKSGTPNKPTFESPGLAFVKEKRRSSNEDKLGCMGPPALASNESGGKHDDDNGGATDRSHGPPVLAKRRSSESWIKSAETTKEGVQQPSNPHNQTKNIEDSSADPRNGSQRSLSLNDDAWIKTKD